MLGSDRGKIGSVEEVVEPVAGHDCYLVVKRGLILEHDVLIPLDAVVRRAQDTVFINTPKIVVPQMGWDHPPSLEGRKSKLAASADNVGQKPPSRR